MDPQYAEQVANTLNAIFVNYQTSYDRRLKEKKKDRNTCKKKNSGIWLG